MRVRWQGSEWRDGQSGEPVWVLWVDDTEQMIYASNPIRSWRLPAIDFVDQFTLIQAELEPNPKEAPFD